MGLVRRVLPESPFEDLEAYRAAGGGAGLDAARRASPADIVDIVEASGLRGRGGAGFPTGTKWRTVASYGSAVLPTTVVINAAEGEPGTYKDRYLLETNAYAVLEGALIAARAVGADSIVVGTKKTFGLPLERLRTAIDEMGGAGWFDGVTVSVVEGPNEYLLGEETALLEVIDGRMPFPRIAPPYRRGVVEVTETEADAGAATAGSGVSASVEMAGPSEATVAPPALVDNVETLANVPAILANGADWFRSVGTRRSPGSLVCTITGFVGEPGVGEVAMGTTLREAIRLIAGGARAEHSIVGVVVGVSNAMLGVEQLDTPLTYEDMAAAGSGLGSGSYLVLDDSVDLLAVAAGISRFLAVESCGQCTPCKQDGLAIWDILTRLCHGQGSEQDVTTLHARLSTVADGARCGLATQHQVVVGSIVARLGSQLAERVRAGAEPVEPMLIAELLDVRGGVAEVDESFVDKRPDWSHGGPDSGSSPADLYDDHREHLTLG